MIRAFARESDADRRVISVKDVPAQEGLRLVQQQQYHVWFDLTEPTEEDYAWLLTTFNFNPLTVDDAKQHDPRAKIADYPGYVFITLHTPRKDGETEASDEIHVFHSTKYFVTVHHLDNQVIENLISLQRSNFHLSEWGTSLLLYRLCDLVIDAYFPVLDDIGDRVDQLEDQIIAATAQEQLQSIFSLKRDLLFLRKTVGPMREVFNAILIRRYEQIDERTLIYLRDVYEHVVRFYDIIDSHRDLVSSALETYLTAISNNLNLVMKRLTIITTIFMPLTFITGFFGMNFDDLPFKSFEALLLAVAIMLLGSIGMLVWFRRERWL